MNEGFESKSSTVRYVHAFLFVVSYVLQVYVWKKENKKVTAFEGFEAATVLKH